ncbi:sulfur carrier protein ThiS [Alkalimarinus sediminis]|uniref:Sulfur carrier protein ThiS n=1 Tax=Alkalimarinus sediminis TaxID=1632866 RepID=A0A9E8HLN4_9ALTE|nr:sulfur carrier protein ThiS [Alkalimarinus sediminis]UZW76875.1 sulfur carrier protein ThiS [Alkalimarinus sediminis]
MADLIRLLALEGKRIAVELNMEIVPRSEHAVTILHQGDNLEIVHAIGGG